MERYPFRLSTTSLTDPMLDVLENIELNMRFGFRNVEVTLEYPRLLPVSEELKRGMLEYQEKYGVEYTIHLPLSLHLTDVNPHIRDASLKTIEEILAMMSEVKPMAYVLHVAPFFKTGGTPLGRSFEVQLHEDRLAAAEDSLKKLKEMTDPQLIAVENLFHDLIYLDDFIWKYGYGVCMDVGHLLLNTSDVFLFYQRYRSLIKVIHLHDVINGRDHQQLGEPGSTLDLKALFYLLNKDNYQGAIVLEQFQTEHIDKSLEAIEKVWNQLMS